MRVAVREGLCTQLGHPELLGDFGLLLIPLGGSRLLLWPGLT